MRYFKDQPLSSQLSSRQSRANPAISLLCSFPTPKKNRVEKFFSPHSFVYGYLCLATGGSGWHLHLRSGQALCHQGNGCPFWRVHCPGMHWNMKWQTGCCLGQSCQICSLPKLKDCNSACTHWLQGIHTGSFHSLWHHGGWAPRWVARRGYWP